MSQICVPPSPKTLQLLGTSPSVRSAPRRGRIACGKRFGNALVDACFASKPAEACSGLVRQDRESGEPGRHAERRCATTAPPHGRAEQAHSDAPRRGRWHAPGRRRPRPSSMDQVQRHWSGDLLPLVHVHPRILCRHVSVPPSRAVAARPPVSQRSIRWSSTSTKITSARPLAAIIQRPSLKQGSCQLPRLFDDTRRPGRSRTRRPRHSDPDQGAVRVSGSSAAACRYACRRLYSVLRLTPSTSAAAALLPS